MFNNNDSNEFVIKLVMQQVEIARKDAEANLINLFTSIGTAPGEAEDIANYFFGTNPKMKELTEALLKDLKIIK